nr:zinc finger BED domain-containing protein RICESLEEPER 2-like [Ipomoea trifida]
MLSAALKYMTAFNRMADEDKLYDAYFQEDENGKRRVGPPSSNDWDNVIGLVQFLKIFYDATLAFSSYKTVTSSHCFTDICTIEANLNAFINSKDVNMSTMAYEMKKKFDKYWEGLEINKLLIVSSVLDPRSKMSFVTICFERLYGKDTPKCMEMKEAIVEVLRKFESVLDVGVTIGDVVPIPNLFTTYTNMVREKGNVEKTSNELDIYLMENIEMPTPNRLEMARDILTIPVSSVASESAFSTSGRILDQYRSSLTPYMVEALILTQDWLRSSLQSDATVSLVQILEETEFMDLLAEEIRKSAGQHHDIDM